MKLQEYAMICFRTLFCLINILVHKDRTEMVLHSKFTYIYLYPMSYTLSMDLSVQEEKIQCLVAEIFAK